MDIDRLLPLLKLVLALLLTPAADALPCHHTRAPPAASLYLLGVLTTFTTATATTATATTAATAAGDALELPPPLVTPQVQRIAGIYEAMYGMTLRDQIKKESGGNFGRMMRYSMEPREKLDAELLFKAMDGIGTSEEVLTEIICMRSNAELEKIKEAFGLIKDAKKKPLDDWVRSEVGGAYLQLLLMLLRAKRSEAAVADDFDRDALARAKDLYVRHCYVAPPAVLLHH